MIYGQAALLGVSAVTFFLLGVMVGNLTSSNGANKGNMAAATGYVEDARITGVVTYRSNGRQLADVGSVVILLPRSAKPEKKLSPGLIMPETFVALDNPTIDAIHNAGGAVVRADPEGGFNVLVDRGLAFRLLAISKKRPSKGRQLDPQQSDVLESWFAPAEKLIRDNDFQWQDIDASSERVEIGVVKFE